MRLAHELLDVLTVLAAVLGVPQHNVSHEDILRRNAGEQPLKDVIYDIASAAHVHLETVSCDRTCSMALLWSHYVWDSAAQFGREFNFSVEHQSTCFRPQIFRDF